jgi:hypothetical protein
MTLARLSTTTGALGRLEAKVIWLHWYTRLASRLQSASAEADHVDVRAHRRLNERADA